MPRRDHWKCPFIDFPSSDLCRGSLGSQSLVEYLAFREYSPSTKPTCRKEILGNWMHAGLVIALARIQKVCFPEGPRIEKIQDFDPGLKLSSEQSQIDIFNRDWTFQSRLKNKAPFVGNYQGRDWKFQSRLKFSIEIEIFNPGLKISIVWIEISRDQSGLIFFNRGALWVEELFFECFMNSWENSFP